MEKHTPFYKKAHSRLFVTTLLTISQTGNNSLAELPTIMCVNLSHIMLTKRSQAQKVYVVFVHLYRIGKECEKSKWWLALGSSELRGGTRRTSEIQVLFFLLNSVLVTSLCSFCEKPANYTHL